MVHRDIKPQNLLLARQGKKHVVKILDFGLAKVTREDEASHNLTASGQMLGTPDYIAPEQTHDAARADIRADLYSLGCTLYFLLAGRPSFEANTWFEMLLAHNTEQATPLDQVRNDVPPELAAVVAKLMAKDPAQRFQKPAELVHALAPFVKTGLKPMPAKPPAESTPETESARSKLESQKPGGRSTAKPPPLMRRTMIEGVCPVPLKTAPSQPTAATSRRKWLVLHAARLLLIASAVALWAGGVFRVKTPEGILVVEVNEPEPDVYFDGDRMTVTWGKDGKTAEIRLKPGTRKVEVKKDGFTAVGEEVELQDGKRRVLTASLVRPGGNLEGAKPDRKPPDAEPPPRHDPPPVVVKNPEPGPPYVDSIGMELVPIPAGRFHMGSDKAIDSLAADNETPRHEVTIARPFWMAACKTTQKQFEQVMGRNPSSFSATGGHRDKVAGIDTARFPVESVTWFDAVEFCNRLSEKEGRRPYYRITARSARGQRELRTTRWTVSPTPPTKAAAISSGETPPAVSAPGSSAGSREAGGGVWYRRGRRRR
jgi:formylglycine-generating enzyme required for sulfatase activity